MECSRDWSIKSTFTSSTAKPMIYLVNLSEKDYIRKKNKWLLNQTVDWRKWSRSTTHSVVSWTQGIWFLEPEDFEKYCEEVKTQEWFTKDNQIWFPNFNCNTFHHCWQRWSQSMVIQKGSKAPQAAGKIHTDFEKDSSWLRWWICRFQRTRNRISC